MTPQHEQQAREKAIAEKLRYNNYVNTPGKLSMLKFRTEFPFTINKALAGFSIPDLLDSDYYQLDFEVFLESRQMNLQRPLVWTLDQKRELIISILKGIYIPPITAVQHKDERKSDRKAILKIIDGKQRVTTVISFCQGEFGIFYEDKEYFFNDLAEQAKHAVNDCFRFDIGYSYYDKPITDSQMIRWFEMINFAGTPQDKTHMETLKNSIRSQP